MGITRHIIKSKLQTLASHIQGMLYYTCLYLFENNDEKNINKHCHDNKVKTIYKQEVKTRFVV